MLNVTAVTLGNQLQIGFLAIPDAVPKVDLLARYTREAFDTLEDSLPLPAAADKPAAARRARAGTDVGTKRKTTGRSTFGAGASAGSRSRSSQGGRAAHDPG
jgi:diacylglycerol O-acyltransferase / wax synthase